ncbi:hypothetical protein ACKKBG_A37760 [Auxenochlorella protothecoides x Auxenochlorella symbiontica]
MRMVGLLGGVIRASSIYRVLPGLLRARVPRTTLAACRAHAHPDVAACYATKASNALRDRIEGKVSLVARAITFTDVALEPPREPTPKEYETLQGKLGYTFKNRYLLRLSLTQQCAAAATNNRTLAWLGDAVLQLVLTEQVLGAVQGSLTATPLGVLDRLRATLVSRAAFQQSARQVDLASYVIMSRNTRDTGGPSPNMLAETFEAVIAAVYMDGGLPAVVGVLEKTFPVSPDHLDLLKNAAAVALPVSSESKVLLPGPMDPAGDPANVQQGLKPGAA